MRYLGCIPPAPMRTASLSHLETLTQPHFLGVVLAIYIVASTLRVVNTYLFVLCGKFISTTLQVVFAFLNLLV